MDPRDVPGSPKSPKTMPWTSQSLKTQSNKLSKDIQIGSNWTSKPVLAMEREARFNLRSFLIKCRNHGGQTKNLCKACARASHHVQTPPLTHTSHHIPAYPTISHHIPISYHIPSYPSICQHILAYSSISKHLPPYHSISQHILAYPSISNISPHILTYPSISQYILRYSSNPIMY